MVVRLILSSAGENEQNIIAFCVILVYFYQCNLAYCVIISLMKRNLIVSLMLLSVLSLRAQIKQEVIASAGGYNGASGVSLSWTLGETIIPTFTNGGITLTHGFQQQLIVTAVEENLEDVVKVTIFPNPASDVINIKFETPLNGEVKLYLIDSNGRMLKTDFMEETMVEKEINLQDIPAGLYFLKMIKGKLSNVYKVVKL